MTGRLILALMLAVMFTACSTTDKRVRFQVANTPFENGGTSETTAALQRALRTKGSGSPTEIDAVRRSQMNDLTAVMQECKSRLEAVSEERKKSNNIALGVSIAGLIAGSIIGPTLVATEASKGTITFFSSVAGAANPTQDLFKERGFDPETYAQRMSDINVAIGNRFTEFQKALDDSGRQTAILGLTADCLKKE